MTTTPEAGAELASSANGFASAGDMAGVVGFAIAICGAAICISYAVSAAERYDRFRRVAQRAVRVVRYTLIGAVVTSGVSVLGYLAYQLSQAAAADPTLVVRGLAAVAFAVPMLATIGWGAERVIERLQNHHETVTEDAVATDGGENT